MQLYLDVFVRKTRSPSQFAMIRVGSTITTANRLFASSPWRTPTLANTLGVAIICHNALTPAATLARVARVLRICNIQTNNRWFFNLSSSQTTQNLTTHEILQRFWRLITRQYPQPHDLSQCHRNLKSHTGHGLCSRIWMLTVCSMSNVRNSSWTETALYVWLEILT